MALPEGSRIGHYDVVELIGVGGMGEVYRARDIKLGRDVAVKVLREELAQDPERLARLEREAKLLASLNHTNVATLHGFDEWEGHRYLVMELVPGQTLADLLRGGPLAPKDVTSIAGQIADALDAAHENGVVHRDLKPANIKITPDGHVKVLDFGLAKAIVTESSTEDPASSPTLTAGASRAGVIIGTAAYMSPEQARGQSVDKRSDIFSFGSVLFEMLTARMPFRGDTVSDVLAAILRSEPDWAELPASIDPRLETIVRGCLEKDPKARRRDIGDVGNALREIQSNPKPPAVAGNTPRKLFPWVAAASLVAGVVTWNLKPPPPRPVMRLSVNLPPSERFTLWWRHVLAFSPDGNAIVYAASSRLFVRRLSEDEAAPIRGPEAAMEPFFSPDGRWLGYFTTRGMLMKVPLDGGAPIALCEAGFPHGASWGSDGTIVFGQGEKGIYRVSDNGGIPELLVEMDETRHEMAHGPEMLPDGDTLLFTLRSERSWDDAQIVAQSLATSERRVLVVGGTDARFVPTGHLIYAREGTVLAAPMDPVRVELTGAAVPVIDGILQPPGTAAGAAQFAFSRNGSLVWAPRTMAADRLAWVDRRGAAELLPLRGIVRGSVYPRLSPGGERLAYIAGTDLWVYDLERNTSVRLTFEGDNTTPVWAPDGTRLFFASSTIGGTFDDLFSVSADGSDQRPHRILERDLSQRPESISPDGRMLAYREIQPGGSGDLWLLPLQSDSEPKPLAATSFDERGMVFAPDGRFVAYVSDESGRDEVYVQPFPGPGPKIAVSNQGGASPVWSPDGGELFYLMGPAVMSVEVRGESLGAPERLFDKPDMRAAILTGAANYDVSKDGERFIMALSGQSSKELHVVLNWFDELERRAPPGR